MTKMNHKTVALAGGGSAGHVIPNLTIAAALGRKNIRCIYLGRNDSIESRLAEDAGLPFFGIRSQGLRRYLTPKNLTLPFTAIAGVADSVRILKAQKPDVVFGKGGFVSLPPVVAASLLGIPVIIHESDGSLGLANVIAARFAKTVCLASVLDAPPMGLSKDKFVVTGNPIRPMDTDDIIPTRPGKKVILVFGGSLGAQTLNDVTESALQELLKLGDVHHVTGTTTSSPEKVEGYFRYDYISEGFPGLLRRADVAICRAGANTIAELLQREIPAVLIPLPTASSRGDQAENAQLFAHRGCGFAISDESLNSTNLLESVRNLLEHRAPFVRAMREFKPQDGTPRIVEMLVQQLGRS